MHDRRQKNRSRKNSERPQGVTDRIGLPGQRRAAGIAEPRVGGQPDCGRAEEQNEHETRNDAPHHRFFSRRPSG